jgi:hypothetical protein
MSANNKEKNMLMKKLKKTEKAKERLYDELIIVAILIAIIFISFVIGGVYFCCSKCFKTKAATVISLDKTA